MSTGRHRKAVGFTLTSIRARHHRLLALVATIAVFLQTLVIQTHVDAVGVAHAIGIERGAGQAVPAQQVSNKAGDPAACPFCEDLATSGTSLLVSGPALLTTAGIIANEALIPIRRVPVQPAHAWQSRAPPISL
jgi:hypothetical protein